MTPAVFRPSLRLALYERIAAVVKKGGRLIDGQMGGATAVPAGLVMAKASLASLALLPYLAACSASPPKKPPVAHDSARTEILSETMQCLEFNEHIVNYVRQRDLIMAGTTAVEGKEFCWASASSIDSLVEDDAKLKAAAAPCVAAVFGYGEVYDRIADGVARGGTPYAPDIKKLYKSGIANALTCKSNFHQG
jgi:hypothetical protein